MTTLAIIETQNIALDVFIVVQKYPSDDGVTRYKWVLSLALSSFENNE